MSTIIFLHPDLGIGGAERLVVDAAIALKAKGHTVHFLTGHHDPSHCFIETKDGTFGVTVVGDWMPRSVFGYFYALCAYIRMIYAALYLVFFSDLKPDLVFCDLVSVCIPILKLKYKVLFYCHFPDQLLSIPGSAIKQMYRAPLNWLEEITTGMADKILVNSKFTAKVFKHTFRKLTVTPDVLYPSLNTDFFDDQKPSLNTSFEIPFKKDDILFLSINRYERKKNLALAVDAMKKLETILSPALWSKIHLIIAGGYDLRVSENVLYFNELEDYVKKNNLEKKITFMKSPSDNEKLLLLTRTACLLYTPEHEHFGIVPLEAMYCRKPVIAVCSGGPTETVVHGETGFLCESTSSDFALAMKEIVSDVTKRERMGELGRKRVENTFSFTAFSNNLDNVIIELLQVKKRQ